MNRTHTRKLALALLLGGTSASVGVIPVHGQTAPADAPASTVPLDEGFQTPPNAARARVWWHWMSGNITKDGIRKDLEWMKRAGIGGLQNFDAAVATAPIVPKRLAYMTPEWKEAFRYAAELASQLDLEFAIASSPGWSQTGGPWVKPGDAMKKVVWSETVVEGNRRFRGKLADLPVATGVFQDLALPMDPQAAAVHAPPNLGGSIAVIAVPIADRVIAKARFATNDGRALNADWLTDGSQQTVEQVAKSTADNASTIVIDYPSPQTVQSITLSIPGAAQMYIGTDVAPQLQLLDSSGQWRKVVDVPIRPVPTTRSFAPVTGQKFRLMLSPRNNPPLDLGPSAPGAFAGFPSSFGGKLSVAELRLDSTPTINEFEVKAGFFSDVNRDVPELSGDIFALDRDPAGSNAGIDPRQIIDLTNRVAPDGSLDWTPPRGRWKLIRLGWSLLGKMNHPATAEATGLEVDKYDREAVKRYLETYIGMYRDTVGDALIGKRGLTAILNDSTEVGAANWTPRMIEQFSKLRGYDPRPWLPTLTGVIVGSREQSERFLYDFRRTIADLHASEHYGTVAEVAHARGLMVYGEALEGARPSYGDDLAMRSHADIPMAAMWTFGKNGPRAMSLADLKGAASIAHLQGRPLAAAESFTSAFSPWGHAPRDLKPVADAIFASGINRIVVHTSVHQPVDDKVPGLSLMVFGQYFTRHETWAEMARPWMDYIARTSYLLQQGRNVADVAYFYGEDRPATALFADAMPRDAPKRYAYDLVNADSVLNLLQVDGSELAAKGGTRYKLLYLGEGSERMTLSMLRKLAELASAGATIVGTAPSASLSLNDDKAEFARTVGQLWSGAPVTQVGKGRVIAGRDVEAALAMASAAPAFEVVSPGSGAGIAFVHRSLPDAEVYFLSNQSGDAKSVAARFRAKGKAPELWRADRGSMEPVSYRTEAGGTVVPLAFEKDDAYFIVFRKPTDALAWTAPAAAWTPLVKIDGPWQVSFQPDRGAPAKAVLPLGSLSDNAVPGIRYFSGVATYRNTFRMAAGVKPGQPLAVDLGEVGDLAEVLVNGKAVGTAWKAPYRLAIGDALRPGINTIEVRVANLWANRLIGDARPETTSKITYTALPSYKPDAPLRPSGLMGPVVIGGTRQEH